jgi:dephospho-CoA kinase
VSETPSLEWISSHYSLLQELEPHLRHDAPTATVNNPAWFAPDDDGKLSVLKVREDLHNQIIAEFFQGHSPVPEGQTPVAIVLAGPPGSGKSTSLRTLFEERDAHITGGLNRNDFVVIDADAIKTALIKQARADGSLDSFIKPAVVRQLEAQAGEVFSDLDLASLVHTESSLIARKVRLFAVRSGYNVIIDQVSAKKRPVKELFESLEAQGYSARVVEIDASRSFSLESTFARYVHAWEKGGTARRVPTEVVDSIYTPEGASKPREVIQSILDETPCKVSSYRRFHAAVLREAPVLVAQGERTPDGLMQVSHEPSVREHVPMTKEALLARHRERAREVLAKHVPDAAKPSKGLAR